MENFKEYGVVGILVLLILKEVFAFVKAKRSSNEPPEWCKGCGFNAGDHNEMRLRKLYEWHKPDPETGKFAWYARDIEIIEAIKKIGSDLVHEFREFRKDWKNGH